MIQVYSLIKNLIWNFVAWCVLQLWPGICFLRDSCCLVPCHVLAGRELNLMSVQNSLLCHILWKPTGLCWQILLGSKRSKMVLSYYVTRKFFRWRFERFIKAVAWNADDLLKVNLLLGDLSSLYQEHKCSTFLLRKEIESSSLFTYFWLAS